MTNKSINLNADVGEVSIEQDAALLPYLSSCNVSCGVHAGDPPLMTATVREAIRLNVSVGAHPSYPDRANFGRRSMTLPDHELGAHLRFQIGSVKALTESFGAQLQHVKPHGALYHDVVHDESRAVILLDVMEAIDPGLSLYGQADSVLADLCQSRGFPFVHEAFGDRRYADQTTLMPRSSPGSVIDNVADFEQQLRQLIQGQVIDVEGRNHDLTVDTICLHSDTEHSVRFAERALKVCDEMQIQHPSPSSGLSFPTSSKKRTEG